MRHPPEHERDSQGNDRDQRAAGRPTGPRRVTRSTGNAGTLTSPLRLIATGLVVAVALILVVIGLSQNLARPSSSPIVVGRNPLIGQPAPEMRLTTIDGEEVVLSDLRGRPVIINFWASWCEPCRDELPLYRAAYERHGDAGLEILGVVHDDDSDAAADFAAGYGVTWPLLLDPDNVAWRDYAGAFLPLSYFVDRDGIVRSVSYGPPPEDALEDQIADIL